MQTGLNLLLVTGIFIAAVFAETWLETRWPGFPGGTNGTKAVTWLAALLLSFPILVAVWRKLQAAAMILASMRVSPKSAGSGTAAARAYVAAGITMVGTLLLVLFLLLLSSTLLPTGNMLLLVLAVMVIAGFRLYRWSIRFYASAQVALRETFTSVPPTAGSAPIPPRHPSPPGPVPRRET